MIGKLLRSSLGWPAVAGVLFAAALGTALFAGRGPDLCDPSVAYREWRGAMNAKRFSVERYDEAAPVARALVGCDRPLLGLDRGALREALGRPARLSRNVDGRRMWVYDLGRPYKQDSSGAQLELTFTGARVADAEAPTLD